MVKPNRLSIILLVFVLSILTACQGSNNKYDLNELIVKRKLTIETVQFADSADKLFHDRIRSFAEGRSDVEIEFQVKFKYGGYGLTPWLLDRKGQGDPPDLIELTPNQMRMAFHHGKLEQLDLSQSQLGDLLI